MELDILASCYGIKAIPHFLQYLFLLISRTKADSVSRMPKDTPSLHRGAVAHHHGEQQQWCFEKYKGGQQDILLAEAQQSRVPLSQCQLT